MNNVHVTRKTLSNGLQAVLVEIDGQEGMLVPEVVRVLGIQERTLTKHVKAHGFQFSNFSPEIRNQLADANVIKLGAGRPPRFIPREAIESLVRFISTPETDAIYAELWGVARAVKSGDIKTAQEIVGVTPKAAIEHLEAALAGWKAAEARADKAEATIVSINRQPAQYARAQGLRGKDIYKEWEVVRTNVDDYRKTQPENPRMKHEGSWTTSWLQRVAGVKATIRENGPTQKSSQLFDRADIEALVTKLLLGKK
jgi:hypothetical protein